MEKKKEATVLFVLKIALCFLTDVLLVRVIFTDITTVLDLEYSTLTEQFSNNVLLQMMFYFSVEGDFNHLVGLQGVIKKPSLGIFLHLLLQHMCKQLLPAWQCSSLESKSK